MRNVCLVLAALLLPAVAAAEPSPCPTVMIILDRSASMDETPSGSFTGPTKMEIAKQALVSLLQRYGTRMPFGFTTFSNSGGCFTGIDILVEPVNGRYRDIISEVNNTVTNQSTNTGEAVQKVSMDAAMHDPKRPASYILLITDGEPNCPDPSTATEPSYTVGQIKMAAMGGVKTFVIGFGHLPAADQQAMNLMADAGGVPCTDPTCGTRRFYAADSQAALNAAIDAVSKRIIGEFGALCDDSCYSNPCMDPTDICVFGACQPDPCKDVSCPAGQYCFTDGTAPGTCVSACATRCKQGETCHMGTCVADPCATASCVPPQVCVGGGCVPDPCGAFSCDSNYICKDGMCVDDPCHYTHCPDGDTCVAAGSCMPAMSASTGGTTGNVGPRAKPGGCDLGRGAPAGAAVPFLLVALFALVRRRPRRHS